MKKNDLIDGCSNRIRANLSYPALLAQLAEECAELSHAALKYRRAMVKENPTPVKTSAASAAMLEEIADILLVLRVIGIDMDSGYIVRVQEYKASRWVDRLDGKEY